MAAVLELIVAGKDQASGVLKTVGKESDGLGGKLKLLAAAATGVVAGFVSFKTITSAIDKTKELGSAVSKMTRETGLSTEAASRLLFAFRRFGIGADEASGMLGIFAKRLKGVADEEAGLAEQSEDTADELAKMNRRLGELHTDLAQADTPEEVQKISNKIADLTDKMEDLNQSPAPKGVVALLADIGVNAMDAAGQIRPMGDLIPEIADKFKAMPDGIEKTGLAMQLFGRSGKDMLPLLNQGSDGLAVLAEQADKLGVTLTGDNLQKIKDYNKAQFDLGEAIGGVKLMIGLELMPMLTTFAQWITDHQPQFRELLVDLMDIAKEKIADLRDVFKELIDKAIELKPKFDDLKLAAMELNESIERLPGPVRDLGAIALVTAAALGALGAIGLPVIGIMKALSVAVAATAGLAAFFSVILAALILPVTVATGALYLLGVRFDDVKGAALSVVDAIGVVIGAIGDLIGWVVRVGGILAGNFTQPLGEVTGALAITASFITNVLIGAIGSLIGWLPSVAAGLWNNFTQPLGVVVEALSTASTWIWNLISDIGNLLATIPGLGGFSTPFETARDMVKSLQSWMGLLIDKIGDVMRWVDKLIEKINSIPSGGIIGDVIGAGGDIIGAVPGGGNPFRAMGGPVSRGMAYLVGERGPELFSPGASGMISPNSSLGGVTVHLSIGTLGAGVTRQHVRSLVDMVEAETRDRRWRGR